MTSAFYPVPPVRTARPSAVETETLDKVAIDVPVTHCINGDRYPGKIVGFTASRKTVKVVLDHSDEVRTYSFRKGAGRFREAGCNFGGLVVGKAESYMDPHR
jgi:hypothetical protein